MRIPERPVPLSTNARYMPEIAPSMAGKQDLEMRSPSEVDQLRRAKREVTNPTNQGAVLDSLRTQRTVKDLCGAIEIKSEDAIPPHLPDADAVMTRPRHEERGGGR
ncbi:hypothetical protein [Actinomadura opuntiae]|uniref:hypothetical protein n=1 Tax=Actinomadura sp. OS1-43 TaxID=604315 RepID=UPI00255AB8DA|nr:hypothetical protein [Actinomadura sp. OS1-43]MDL4818287.1 hypothetical protein [Actinomadura sp. OS1-43]